MMITLWCNRGTLNKRLLIREGHGEQRYQRRLGTQQSKYVFDLFNASFRNAKDMFVIIRSRI